MTKDEDRPLFPGEIRSHASGPGDGPDIGLEVGLRDGLSLYVGELAQETLLGAGIPAEFANPRHWWVALVDRAGITPIAMTVPTEAGGEGDMMISAIATAIRGSMVARVQDLLAEEAPTFATGGTVSGPGPAPLMGEIPPRHPITRGIE